MAVFVGLKIKTLIEDAPVPVLRKDVWWGRGERRPEDPAIKGYKIEVPDTVSRKSSATEQGEQAELIETGVIPSNIGMHRYTDLHLTVRVGTYVGYK